MPLDKEELLFDHLVARTIDSCIKNNLWNQIQSLSLPSYLMYDDDKLNKTKVYMEKYTNPGISIYLMESDYEVFFILSKTQMYKHFNFFR